MLVDSKGQQPGQCRTGRFVTAPLFLMTEWSYLNTEGNFIVLDCKPSESIFIHISGDLFQVVSWELRQWLGKLTHVFSVSSVQVGWFDLSHISAAKFQAQAIQEHRAEVHCILWPSWGNHIMLILLYCVCYGSHNL